MKPKVFVTRRLPQAALAELGEVCQAEIWDYDTPPSYQVMLEKVRGIEGLLCLLTDKIDAGLMAAAPKLKVISQCAVGFDNIDIPAATERGIAVGNTPGVLTEATADFAFALLMAAARRLGEAIDTVRMGQWETWGLTTLLGQDVYAATLGLIGLGRIGKAVAKRARGFSMRVLYYDLSRQPDAEAELGLEYCELDVLLGASDFISVHVNLSERTRSMIDARAFSMMKPNAMLINTSRGAVVDHQALYQALTSGQIGYAALDVTDPEPLPAGHPLLALPNVIVVPHIASATVKTRTKMAQMAVKNLIAGLRGETLPYPVNFT